MSGGAVSFPLAAVAVRDVLTQRIADVPIYIDVPRTPGDTYVRVLALGGRRFGRGELTERVVQLLAYGKTSGYAIQLCERAVSALVSAGDDPAEKRIRRVEVSAEPADYADPDTGAPRAGSTIVALMRGVHQ